MKTRISMRGQVSLPAAIRRRWETDVLVIEDLGDRVILRPIPRDPIGAAASALASGKVTSRQARERVRREEQAAEARKHQR